MAKLPRYATIIFTAVVLAWFFVITVTPHQQVYLTSEKRVSNQFPKFTNWSEFPKFAASLDSYLSDWMPYRAELVGFRSLSRLKLFNETASDRVMAGKDGWLFLSGIDVHYFRNDFPYSDKELVQWGDMLQKRSDWLKHRGIPYLFVVAPSKQTIYPEYVASRYNKVQAESRWDQLIAYLSTHTDVNFIDLRPVLKQAKSEKNFLYSKTDSHWNSSGALIAAKSILNKLNEIVPGAKMQVPDVVFEPRPYRGGQAIMLNVGEALEEKAQFARVASPNAKVLINLTKTYTPADSTGAMRLLLSENKNQELPRALVLRDSFTTALQPYLSENFSHAAYCWQHNLPAKLVAAHRPDVVLEVYCERFLMDNVPKNQFDSSEKSFVAGSSEKAKDPL